MKPIIIANWKMKLGFRDSRKLAQELNNKLTDELLNDKGVVLCPSASSFLLVAEVIKDKNVSLGVQDIFWADEGAFTGCESPKFIYEAGGRYAIIGHSERRQYLAETDEMVHKKVQAALLDGLTPILCVGETLEQRRAGQTDHVVMNQVIKALSGLDLIPGEQLVIAYEPVWAIGTGQEIKPSDAQHVFKLINQAIIDLWPLTIAKNNVRIIYGGSVDGSNASEFVNLEHFSGYLVGGASVKAEEFMKIVESC